MTARLQSRAPLSLSLILAIPACFGACVSTASNGAAQDGSASEAGTAAPPAAHGDAGAATDAAVGFDAGNDADAPAPPSSGEAGTPSPKPAHVTFRTLVTGQYASATGGGGGTVTAASASAGATETFAMTDVNGGALQDGDTVYVAAGNGDYLSAAGGGGGALTADAVTAGPDETFIVHRLAGSGVVASGDAIALGTSNAVNYVSAINGGGGEVAANAPWAKSWETFTLSIAGAPPPPASTAKQKVLAYLASIAGKKTIAGQHDKNNATPTDATDQVRSITGKQPGLWSADFGFGQDALDNRGLMIAQAQTQWGQGAVVQLMYHACIPTRDELCSWDDIGGASPQHLTDAQWTDLVTDGGTLNQSWKARLDTLSPFFAQLKAAGVAPLFRPHHEMNQGVFWWGGRGGPDGTRKLFQITHDYLAGTKGFDNIIWVWDLQDFSTLTTDVTDYDPGAAYYDIAALDFYDGPYEASEYALMQSVAGSKPIAIGECSTPPTAALLAQQPGWAFFMLWPDFVAQNSGALPALYSAPNVLTEEQMPGW